jgi:hypothetical protein
LALVEQHVPLAGVQDDFVGESWRRVSVRL